MENSFFEKKNVYSHIFDNWNEIEYESRPQLTHRLWNVAQDLLYLSIRIWLEAIECHRNVNYLSQIEIALRSKLNASKTQTKQKQITITITM